MIITLKEFPFTKLFSPFRQQYMPPSGAAARLRSIANPEHRFLPQEAQHLLRSESRLRLDQAVVVSMAHLESFVQENARDALWLFFPQRLVFRQALVVSVDQPNRCGTPGMAEM